MKKKLKVLVLFDGASPTKIDQDFSEEMKTEDWKTEANVMDALGKLGYVAEHLAIYDDLDLLRQKLESFAPDVLFNLVEQFKNISGFDQNIVSLLEMLGIPFTGCCATGLLLSKHKGLSKNIVGYHHVHSAALRGHPARTTDCRVRRPKFPMIIKPVKDEASYGISRASFVETDDQFRERVTFIHEKHNSDAIAEEYIPGRELYGSVIGNSRLHVFPIRELVFREVPPNEPKIATFKAKWDEEYRKRWGLENQFAPISRRSWWRISKTPANASIGCSPSTVTRASTCACRPRTRLYFIEANPNPILAEDEDFAQAAAKAELPYPQLIDRIIRLALSRERAY